MKFVGDEGLFLDIGAHVGEFSLTVAKAHPGLSVVAFEPNEDLSPLIVLSAQENGLTNIRVESSAVSNFLGDAWFEISDESALSKLRPPGGSGANDARVQVTTVDHYVQSVFPENRVGLVKIDVEGNEACVLEGMTRLLNLPGEDAPSIVYESLEATYVNSGRTPSKVDGFLRKYGYRTFEICDPHGNRTNNCLATKDQVLEIEGVVIKEISSEGD